MGVSKNRGTPKWMVYNAKKPIKIDDLGVPLFLETPIFYKKKLFQGIKRYPKVPCYRNPQN